MGEHKIPESLFFVSGLCESRRCVVGKGLWYKDALVVTQPSDASEMPMAESTTSRYMLIANRRQPASNIRLLWLRVLVRW